MTIYLYDVCNDYSLNLADNQTSPDGVTCWKIGVHIICGRLIDLGYNRYKELIYLRSEIPDLYKTDTILRHALELMHQE